MNEIAAVERFLLDSGVEYELVRHSAVVTVEESRNVVIVENCCSCKNLFVKDRKSGHFYLAVLRSDKHADLRSIGDYLGCGRLEFPCEQVLNDVLGVSRGAVSPFAILNDTCGKVKLAIDCDILNSNRVKFHPNDNTASVILTNKNFLKYLSAINKSYIIIDTEYL